MIYTYIKKIMRIYYFKELAHAVVEADKSKICRAGGQDARPGKS